MALENEHEGYDSSRATHSHHSSHNHNDHSHSGTDHTHEHCHSHTHDEEDDSPTPYLLKYMLEHNSHHAEELHKLIHELDEAGYKEASLATGRALAYYEKGNVELTRAVESLG